MDRWKALFKLAARQGGCVTAAQAGAMSISRSTLSERARREGWQHPYRGVLVVPGLAAGDLCDVWAAILSSGAGAVAAGETSAAIWGLTPRYPQPVVVLVPHGRSSRPQPGRLLLRSSLLLAEDVTQRHGVSLTRAPWTMTDLARTWPERRLIAAFGIADRRRLLTLNEVAAVAARRGAFPGRARLARVLDELHGELTHSRAERTARRLLTEVGVRLHPRPYPVWHDHRRIAEIDLAVPEVLYGAEIDGPHHLLPGQAQADRSRDRHLRRLGWTIERFSTDEVERTPTVFVRQVLETMCRLRPSLLRTLG